VGNSRRALEPRSQQCTARTRKDPETGEQRQCMNMAIRGSNVCRMHGGATSQVKAKAAQRVEAFKAEAEIARFLEQHKPEPVENPLEALRELAGEVLAIKDWIRGKVTKLEYESSIQGEQIAAVMQLYSAWTDKAERILVNIGKLNIDERLMNIQTAQAQVLMRVMSEVIMKMLDDPAKRDQARVLTGELIEKYDHR
jgi:hypothetical protein